MPEPRLAVVGAGPVGTLIAAALAHGGRRFQWVVRNPRRRTELDSLVLQLPEGGSEISLDGVEFLPSVERVNPYATVVVAVKGHQIKAVLDLAGPRSDVLVVANGLLEGEYMLGLLYGGAILRSGALVTSKKNELFIGSQQDGPLPVELARLLSAPFVYTEAIPNIRELMWHKLALNCIVNPLTALLDCDNGELLGRLHGPLVQGLLRELEAVIQAAADSRFREPSRMELLAETKQLLQATRTNSSSMREDLSAGRETEVSALNLAVSEYGRSLGIACPVNELLGRMIILLAGRRTHTQQAANNGP